MTVEQYVQMTGSSEEALLEQAMEPAKQQVMLDLAVSAIIKAENIEVSDEEVAAEFQRQADQVKMDVETLKKYMEEAVVKEQLLRNKAIAVVADSAVAVKPEIKAEEETPEAPAEESPVEEAPKPKRTRRKKAAEPPAEEKAEEKTEG